MQISPTAPSPSTVAALRVAYLDLDTGAGFADGVGVLVGLRDAERGAEPVGLGHPVAEAQTGADPGQPLFQPAQQLGGPHGAAPADASHRAEVEAVEVRPIEQTPQLGRHQRPVGGPVGFGELEVLIFPPPARRRVHQPGTRDRRHDQLAVETADVKHGRRRDDAGRPGRAAPDGGDSVGRDPDSARSALLAAAPSSDDWMK